MRDRPSYEEQYVEYIREYVMEGDKVVIIGGFYGVSTVAAATQTGDAGSVTTFEATPDGAKRVNKTAKLNNVQHIVDVNAASVGSVYQLKGRELGDNKIPPDQLPDCDILAIDCDGCELDVLENINISPRIIIVEHHGELNSERSELVFIYQENYVKGLLLKKGYTIIDQSSHSRTREGIKDNIGWFVAKRD
jgi:hypothetical protein